MDANRTEIIFLLDRSGSMGGLEDDTINGYNTFLQKQSKLKGETLVTTVLFDHQYEVLCDGVEAQKALLTEESYYVRGGTALLDAVGKTILEVGHRLSKEEEEKRPGKVIFVITTDGMENSSVEFTYKKVKELITHQQEKYHWTFLFLGANIDVAEEGGNMGLRSDSVFEYEATPEGVSKMYEVASEAVYQNRKE
ncbi:MAG TPA: hypothetical protein DHN33_05000 [Eubacteriaceae bacterium]|nr:hypothetical protein [Eubacteriaceae bacterium]